MDGTTTILSYWFETFDVDWKTTPIDSWLGIYDSIVDVPEHLDVLREYRDTFLLTSEKGKHYVDALYRNSNEALQLLRNNPRLLKKSNLLLHHNIDAVRDVLATGTGHIDDTREILAFLGMAKEYADGELGALINAIIQEIYSHVGTGESFLGFNFVQ